jgi:hypothetical protein
MTRSTTATAEAIFWLATEASAIRARTTSLDPWSKGRPGNVALIKTGVPSQFLVTMPRDGAIIFADLWRSIMLDYQIDNSGGLEKKDKLPRFPASRRSTV